tara:strand:+ start:51 stop:764 length:714 start_codon:yes stop_codon:yes gene_type:complete
MKPILLKELRNFFNSPSTYFVIGVFLLITSLLIWIFPDPAPNILEAGTANLSAFFEFTPWLILLLTPIITMGVLSEEIKGKTLELLLTKPINEFSIIFGKFLACLIFIIIIFFPTIIYIFCINDLSQNSIDFTQIITGYTGLIFVSSSFISIGIFFSAISNKQLIAFVLTFITILFLLEGINIIQKMEILEVLQIFSITERAEGFYKGIIDLKDIMFFTSITILFLILSTEILKKRA